jgi:polysaccharide export outer membrane protein
MTGIGPREGRRLPVKALARPASRVVVRLLAAFSLAVAVGAGGLAAAQDSPPPAVAPSAAPGYTIGPSDILQIIVWREPDLTREVTVRFDGMITVPLLGDLQAAGRAPGELAESVAQGLRQYVEAPRVTVGVSQANSARFYVIGQVTKSGEFLLSGHTTVLQGLALAGGFRDFAKTESIVIVRRDQTVVQVNYKRIADGRDVSQNVLLLPEDTIVVP